MIPSNGCAENQALLLRTCGSVLQELSSIRKEVREILQRLPPVEPVVEALPDTISSTCAVEERALRELLSTAFSAGDLSIDLHRVAQQADVTDERSEFMQVNHPLWQALLSEQRRGSLRVTVLGPAAREPSLERALANYLEVAAGDPSRAPDPKQNGVILISPAFRTPSWPLVEAVLRRCASERLAPPLKMLSEAIGSLLVAGFPEHTPMPVFDEVQLIGLLAAQADGSAASTRLRAMPGGRMYVSEDDTTTGTNLGPVFPVYEAGDEAPERLVGNACRDELEAALLAVEAHLPKLKEAFGIGSAVDGAETCRAPSHHLGLPLGLLGALHVPGVLEALDLPEALCRSTSGGALLWALEAALHRAAASAVVSSDFPVLQCVPDSAAADGAEPRRQANAIKLQTLQPPPQELEDVNFDDSVLVKGPVVAPSSPRLVAAHLCSQEDSIEAPSESVSSTLKPQLVSAEIPRTASPENMSEDATASSVSKSLAPPISPAKFSSGDTAGNASSTLHSPAENFVVLDASASRQGSKDSVDQVSPPIAERPQALVQKVPVARFASGTARFASGSGSEHTEPLVARHHNAGRFASQGSSVPDSTKSEGSHGGGSETSGLSPKYTGTYDQANGDRDKSNKSVTRMLFAECFRDDLVQARQLLMSQVNNLYKMRNGGESLLYRDAGYDKLHDFILDIPGLGLQGCGNHMEVRIVNFNDFEEFCSANASSLAGCRFQKPAPVPESFKWQVIEVFRRLGVREIPIKSFRDIWNQSFPDEKLHSKIFGYRDIRGLLANVPVLDRVGGKNHAKYVLKPEISLEPNPMENQADKQPMEPSWVEPNGGIYGRPPSMDQPLWSAAGALSGLSNEAPRSQQRLAAPAPTPTRGSQQFTQPADSAPWDERGSNKTTPWDFNLESATQRISAVLAGQKNQAARPPGNWAGGIAATQQAPQQRLGLPGNIGPLGVGPMGHAGAPSIGARDVPKVLKDLLDDDMVNGAGTHPSASRAAKHPGQQVRPSTSPANAPLAGGAVGEELRAAAAAAVLAAPVSPWPSATQVPSSMPPGLDLRMMHGCQPDPETGSLRGSLPTGLKGRLESVDEQDALTVSKIPSAGDIQVSNFEPDAPDAVPEQLSAAGEFRRKRKALKAAGVKTLTGFVSSPGALSSGDRDASKHQGKFDMASLCQAQMDTDKYCMIVDFYNGRVLFSSTLCDNLFQLMAPLPQRDITDLIYEDDRLTFSAAVMYLSIGKFSTMDPQRLRISTSIGVQYAMISARQLADNLWRVDFELCPEDEDDHAAAAQNSMPVGLGLHGRNAEFLPA